MSQEISTPSVLRQGETWCTDQDPPPIPADSEVRELLDAVGESPNSECIVVRLQLSSSRTHLRRRIRNWLQEEEGVIGTSIGRTVGSSAPDTFDIAVEPGYDLASVGNALADVDQVVAVAAADFETAQVGTRADCMPGDGSQGAIDEVFAELREEVEMVPYEVLVEELEDQALAGSDVDFATLVGDGDHPTPESHDLGEVHGGKLTSDPGISSAEELATKLDTLESRVAALESLYGQKNGCTVGERRAAGDVHDATARSDGGREAAVGDGIESRLDAIESAVDELVASQRQVREALLTDRQ